MSTLIVTKLGTDGDLAGGFGLTVAKSSATAQKIRSRLRLVLGEWFLDPDAGVPWLPTPFGQEPVIFGPVADLGYIERTIKTSILGTTGVAGLLSFTISLDRTTRAATVTVAVQTDDGDVENIEVIL